MKKIIAVATLSLLLALLWILEPLSINPFYKPEAFSVQSNANFQCPDEIDKVKAETNKIVENAMSNHAFIGVSAGVYKQSCGTYVAASGYRSKRNQLAFQTNTISRIASISKPMTAVAIMQLYEQGRLDLDAPIQRYLPNLPQKFNNSISVRQLLNHTAGIPHYTSKLDAMSFTHYSTSADRLDFIAQKGLAPPGERFNYSSFGYTILGEIIESVSEQYENYMRNNIWQKAGMTNTSLEHDLNAPNKSRLYLKAGPFFVRSPHTNLSLIYAGGGIQSTSEDLLKFGAAILNNTLIKRETLELMIDTKGLLPPPAGDNPYGLGWGIKDDPKKGKIIMHAGAQPGVNSSLKIYLDKGIVAVVISNAFGSQNSVSKLSKEMEELVL